MKKALIIFLAVGLAISFSTVALAGNGKAYGKSKKNLTNSPEVVECWYDGEYDMVGLLCIEWAYEAFTIEEATDKFSIDNYGVIENCLLDDDGAQTLPLEVSYDIGTGDDGVIFTGAPGGPYTLCIDPAIIEAGLTGACADGEYVPGSWLTEIKGLLNGPEWKNNNPFSTSGCEWVVPVVTAD